MSPSERGGGGRARRGRCQKVQIDQYGSRPQQMDVDSVTSAIDWRTEKKGGINLTRAA